VRGQRDPPRGIDPGGGRHGRGLAGWRTEGRDSLRTLRAWDTVSSPKNFARPFNSGPARPRKGKGWSTRRSRSTQRRPTRGLFLPAAPRGAPPNPLAPGWDVVVPAAWAPGPPPSNVGGSIGDAPPARRAGTRGRPRVPRRGLWRAGRDHRRGGV